MWPYCFPWLTLTRDEPWAYCISCTRERERKIRTTFSFHRNVSQFECIHNRHCITAVTKHMQCSRNNDNNKNNNKIKFTFIYMTTHSHLFVSAVSQALFFISVCRQCHPSQGSNEESIIFVNGSKSTEWTNWCSVL